MKGGPRENTTIALVATDATLTKAQANRVATMAHDGLARAIYPVHTPMDGDLVFAASTGKRPLANPAYALAELGAIAANVLARAVARAVYEATALPFAGALPALARQIRAVERVQEKWEPVFHPDARQINIRSLTAMPLHESFGPIGRRIGEGRIPGHHFADQPAGHPRHRQPPVPMAECQPESLLARRAAKHRQ